MTAPTLEVPWLPRGATRVLAGRGEVFYRHHQHPDPGAPTLLLLHGWTASSDLQWFTAYRELARCCSFVGIDHRGHGRGLRSPDPFELEACADDAAALVRALGIGPIVTVGYSMGGPIAMLLTRRHPDLVAGMVLEATALEWRERLPERLRWRAVRVLGWMNRSFAYPRWLRASTARLLGTGHDLERYLPWITAEVRRNDPWAIVEAGRALGRFDARSWARTLGVPAGVLITTHDHLVPPRKQWALAEAVGALRHGMAAELAADHLCPWVQHQEWAAATAALVDRVSEVAFPRRAAG